MNLLLAFSVAIALFPIQMPTDVTWVKDAESVHTVLDTYAEQNNTFSPTGLAVKIGDSCIIYTVDLQDVRTEEIYIHEYMHCMGLNHEQIAEIRNRTALRI